MGLLDIVNYSKISDLDRGAKNQDKLRDLEERAAIIAGRTGEHPVSWYEFQKRTPHEDPDRTKKILKGALIWALISGGIAVVGSLAVTGAVMSGVVAYMLAGGALIGGLEGASDSSSNAQRSKAIDSYSDYLDAFENRRTLSNAMSNGQEAGYNTRDTEPRQPFAGATRSTFQQR
jgi:hypothetical protein